MLTDSQYAQLVEQCSRSGIRPNAKEFVRVIDWASRVVMEYVILEMVLDGLFQVSWISDTDEIAVVVA